MRERVATLVGPRARSMWVSTFHSTCVRILRNQASLLPGLNSNFSIYDADDSRRLLLMIGKDMGLDIKRYSPRLLANAISNLKNELIDPQQARGRRSTDDVRRPGPHRRRGLRRIPAAAAGGQRAGLRRPDRRDRRGAAGLPADRRSTTGGGSGTSWSTSTRTPTTRSTCWCANWSARDLDDGEDGVPPGELCVVGDADQSIYAFRGATIRNIEDFERDYPNATTILLEQNYRSTQNILSAANSVISRNAGRREKRLWTDAGDGRADRRLRRRQRARRGPVHRRGDRRARRPTAASPTTTSRSSTAPTTRRASLEEVFIRAGIPYKVVGGVRFYERREIRDIVAYLRVLDNPGDAVSMRRILNTPRRGIGDRAEACVAVYAENTGVQLQRRAAGRRRRQGADAEHPLGEGDCRFRRAARRTAQAGLVDGDLGDLVEAVLDRTGYRSELESSSRPAGPGPAGQPQRIGQRRTRIQHRPGQCAGAARRASPTTRTCRTPACWRSSWSGCRWSPTPTRCPSTAPVW